jgi:hypothetical protein
MAGSIAQHEVLKQALVIPNAEALPQMAQMNYSTDATDKTVLSV